MADGDQLQKDSGKDSDDEIAELRIQALLTKKVNEAEVSPARNFCPKQENLPLPNYIEEARPKKYFTKYSGFRRNMNSNLLVLTSSENTTNYNKEENKNYKGSNYNWSRHKGEQGTFQTRNENNYFNAVNTISSSATSKLALPQHKYLPKEDTAEASSDKSKLSARWERLNASTSEDSESDSDSGSSDSGSDSSSTSSSSSDSDDSSSSSESSPKKKKDLKAENSKVSEANKSDARTSSDKKNNLKSKTQENVSSLKNAKKKTYQKKPNQSLSTSRSPLGRSSSQSPDLKKTVKAVSSAREQRSVSPRRRKISHSPPYRSRSPIRRKSRTPLKRYSRSPPRKKYHSRSPHRFSRSPARKRRSFTPKDTAASSRYSRSPVTRNISHSPRRYASRSPLRKRKPLSPHSYRPISKSPVRKRYSSRTPPRKEYSRSPSPRLRHRRSPSFVKSLRRVIRSPSRRSSRSWTRSPINRDRCVRSRSLSRKRSFRSYSPKDNGVKKLGSDYTSRPLLSEPRQGQHASSYLRSRSRSPLRRRYSRSPARFRSRSPISGRFYRGSMSPSIRHLSHRESRSPVYTAAHPYNRNAHPEKRQRSPLPFPNSHYRRSGSPSQTGSVYSRKSPIGRPLGGPIRSRSPFPTYQRSFSPHAANHSQYISDNSMPVRNVLPPYESKRPLVPLPGSSDHYPRGPPLIYSENKDLPEAQPRYICGPRRQAYVDQNYRQNYQQDVGSTNLVSLNSKPHYYSDDNYSTNDYPQQSSCSRAYDNYYNSAFNRERINRAAQNYPVNTQAVDRYSSYPLISRQNNYPVDTRPSCAYSPDGRKYPQRSGCYSQQSAYSRRYSPHGSKSPLHATESHYPEKFLSDNSPRGRLKSSPKRHFHENSPDNKDISSQVRRGPRTPPLPPKEGVVSEKRCRSYSFSPPIENKRDDKRHKSRSITPPTENRREVLKTDSKSSDLSKLAHDMETEKTSNAAKLMSDKALKSTTKLPKTKSSKANEKTSMSAEVKPKQVEEKTQQKPKIVKKSKENKNDIKLLKPDKTQVDSINDNQDKPSIESQNPSKSNSMFEGKVDNSLTNIKKEKKPIDVDTRHNLSDKEGETLSSSYTNKRTAEAGPEKVEVKVSKTDKDSSNSQIILKEKVESKKKSAVEDVKEHKKHKKKKRESEEHKEKSAKKKKKRKEKTEGIDDTLTGKKKRKKDKEKKRDKKRKRKNPEIIVKAESTASSHFEGNIKPLLPEYSDVDLRNFLKRKVDIPPLMPSEEKLCSSKEEYPRRHVIRRGDYSHPKSLSTDSSRHNVVRSGNSSERQIIRRGRLESEKIGSTKKIKLDNTENRGAAKKDRDRALHTKLQNPANDSASSSKPRPKLSVYDRLGEGKGEKTWSSDAQSSRGVTKEKAKGTTQSWEKRKTSTVRAKGRGNPVYSGRPHSNR